MMPVRSAHHFGFPIGAGDYSDFMARTLIWRTTIPQRRRLRRRLFVHHLPLFLVTAGLGAVLYLTRPYRDVWMKLSFSTAYPALLLLAATLLIGPLNILARRRNPVSSDLRRDIGIWGGILVVAHTVVGQNVHLRGRPWLYYLYQHWSRHLFPFRHDLFGLANYTGLLCTLVVALLLATSNDYSLRRLGTPQWKKLQRWNYAAFLLVAVHAAGYETIEHQKIPFVLTTVLGIGITVLLQISAFLLRRTSPTA